MSNEFAKQDKYDDKIGQNSKEIKHAYVFARNLLSFSQDGRGNVLQRVFINARNLVKLKTKDQLISSHEIINIHQLLTSPNESATAYVCTYIIYVQRVRYFILFYLCYIQDERNSRPRGFAFISRVAISGWVTRNFSRLFTLSVAALMDAESGILGRQLRGAFRGIAERSDEAAFEGKV